MLQRELTSRVMQQSQQLELCTETCKDELDMQCINQCGTEYMQITKVQYDDVLAKHLKQ